MSSGTPERTQFSTSPTPEEIARDAHYRLETTRTMAGALDGVRPPVITIELGDSSTDAPDAPVETVVPDVQSAPEVPSHNLSEDDLSRQATERTGLDIIGVRERLAAKEAVVSAAKTQEHDAKVQQSLDQARTELREGLSSDDPNIRAQSQAYISAEARLAKLKAEAVDADTTTRRRVHDQFEGTKSGYIMRDRFDAAKAEAGAAKYDSRQQQAADPTDIEAQQKALHDYMEQLVKDNPMMSHEERVAKLQEFKAQQAAEAAKQETQAQGSDEIETLQARVDKLVAEKAKEIRGGDMDTSPEDTPEAIAARKALLKDLDTRTGGRFNPHSDNYEGLGAFDDETNQSLNLTAEEQLALAWREDKFAKSQYEKAYQEIAGVPPTHLPGETVPGEAAPITGAETTDPAAAELEKPGEKTPGQLIDAILNDPNLSKEQKLKQIEEIVAQAKAKTAAETAPETNPAGEGGAETTTEVKPAPPEVAPKPAGETVVAPVVERIVAPERERTMEELERDFRKAQDRYAGVVANSPNSRQARTLSEEFGQARVALIDKQVEQFASNYDASGYPPEERAARLAEYRMGLFSETQKSTNNLVYERVGKPGRNKFTRALRKTLEITGKTAGAVGLVAFGGILGVAAVGYLIYRDVKKRNDAKQQTLMSISQPNVNVFDSLGFNTAEGQASYRDVENRLIASGRFNQLQTLSMYALDRWLREQEEARRKRALGQRA